MIRNITIAAITALAWIAVVSPIACIDIIEAPNTSDSTESNSNNSNNNSNSNSSGGNGNGGVINNANADEQNIVSLEQPNYNDIACESWIDCGPYYYDLNSGLDCFESQCICDKYGQYDLACALAGGFFNSQACYCEYNVGDADIASTIYHTEDDYYGGIEPGPPPYNGTPGCTWVFIDYECDADEWIDTSHYETRCYYDTYLGEVCDEVWVYDGYYTSGACTGGYWDEDC